MREVMRVDNISWPEATLKVQEMDAINDSKAWVMHLPHMYVLFRGARDAWVQVCNVLHRRHGDCDGRRGSGHHSPPPLVPDQGPVHCNTSPSSGSHQQSYTNRVGGGVLDQPPAPPPQREWKGKEW